MPTASQYQSVFRINKADATNTDNGSQLHAAKARRNRQPLSCEACRYRKLKCDRQTPCAPCSKRGDAASSSCNYSRGGRDGPSTSVIAPSSTRSAVQQRLQKLEEMVTGLMQPSSFRSSDAFPPHSAPVDQRMNELSVSSQGSPGVSDPSPAGHLDRSGLERQYLGATHWTTILDNIRDIQNALDPNTHAGQDGATCALPEAPDIVLETSQPLTLTDVLAVLPPRVEVDKLLSTYFTTEYLRAPYIHSGKFLREYQAFWADPSSVSFLWISMLFSILWCSSQLEALQSMTIAKNLYLTKAAQALVAGRYQKARPYSVEGTLLYAQCNYYLSKEDSDSNAWMIMALAVRLAMKMGYHRDPCHLAGISPFEGEMRRRTFFHIETLDILLSLQAGLPTIIQEDECDTEPPRNLYDEDFAEDCEVIPVSRPETEPTPMLYFCCKSRFAKTHKRVIRHALTLKSPSYEDTMRLDAELHNIHAHIPPSLKMRSLESSLLDQSHQIMRRLHIEVTYLQSLCVLHRKYLSHDRQNPAFAYSRKASIDAALKLLSCQAELHIAIQPGGRLHKDKWMLSSITLHDFLLAAMVVCLDLYETHTKLIAASPEDFEAQANKIDAIKLSHEIWTSGKKFSRDAHRASDVLAIMLSKIPRPNIPAKRSNGGTRDPSSISQTPPSATGLVGSISGPPGGYTWYTNPDLTATTGFPPLQLDATDPINTIFDGSEDIDWGALDQYLVEGGGGTDDPFDWQVVEALR